MDKRNIQQHRPPDKITRKPSHIWALILIGSGLSLLIAGGSYLGYSSWAQSNLESLNVSVEPNTDPNSTLNSLRDNATNDVPTIREPEAGGIAMNIVQSYILFPGELMHPIYWNEPLAVEGNFLSYDPFIKEYEPFTPDSAAPLKSLSPPSWISIPAIELDSEVRSLQIFDKDDSRAYETPKDVVGHIPESANPGANGTAWFFGHLESPIAGEGNVFINLPRIPELIRQGPVYVTISSEDNTFLYQLISSEVIHENDLYIQDLGGPTIRLVACVPRFEYDYRLVITGILKGIKS